MANNHRYFLLSKQHRLQTRTYIHESLNYIIIVPTLRCDLSCDYCQVSRAALSATGFDWTQEITTRFLDFVSTHATNNVKIEIQGGEPTLILDIVANLIHRIRNIKTEATFVICTNLQNIKPELLDILSLSYVTISSSLDGTPDIQKANRTKVQEQNNKFFNNLHYIRENFDTSKISLIPTITEYEKINNVIDFYYELEIPHIFLRPVSYHGFARRKKIQSDRDTLWIKKYLKSLDYICEQNSLRNHKLIETNLSIHIKKIFDPNDKGYVDLRTPNKIAKDFLVVDYDGAFYPTDEARMLSRVGVIDLRIGNLIDGYNNEKIYTLNEYSSNENDKACSKCKYQLMCGVDNIDKIARYNSIAFPTEQTFFCRFHFALFNYVDEHIGSQKEEDISNLNLHLTGKYNITTLFRRFYNDPVDYNI